MMENKNDSNSSATETSESFVVRMWQEDPGEWRGTVQHVQSQSQLGFTKVEQAYRFIQRHTTGVEAPAAETAKRPTVPVNFGLSRRTTRMLAFALAIIILSIVGMVAVSQGNVGQLLGFGH